MPDLINKTPDTDTAAKEKNAPYKKTGTSPIKKRSFENKPSGGGKKPSPAGGKRPLSKRNIILIAVAAGLAVLLLVGLLLWDNRPKQPQSSSLAGISSESIPLDDVLGVESLPETLDTRKFVDTILPETEDAGMEYCQETLFLGDSNTERMLYYSDVTGASLQNTIGVVSMGITTFTSSRFVRFEGDSKSYSMPEAVAVLQPKRVVITFGTNNVGMDIGTFASHYKSALDAVKDSYPYADIIIGSVFPVDQYRQNTSITMKGIDQMNVALASLAKQEDVKFLNWTEAIYDEAIGYSGFEYTVQDGVHLTRKGMEAIFKYFRTHSFIAEDLRPALKKIPNRVGIMPGTVTKDPYKQPGPFDWSKYEEKNKKSEVSVTVSAYDKTNGKTGGGTVSSGGNSGTSFTVIMKPGESITISASADSGYELSGWGASHGSTSGASGASFTFTLPTDVKGDTSVSVSAIFTKKEKEKPKPSSTASPTDA